MPDIFHEITVNASPEEVFKALTTEEGLKSWWTSSVQAQSEIGSIALFGFDNDQTTFRMQIDKLEPNKLIEWTCLGDPEEWKETKVIFEIISDNTSSTTIKFKHLNWKSIEGIYSMCNTTWGHLMFYLKNYVEGNSNSPLFN